ncbi:hypothetical protein [Chromobacterium violaceum]|uniref:hypothetical protein n=1 Tax=Chromobacterium violaceum TaxID=536 RepID=UPI001C8BC6C9|nr:hypothetical protein [Chromobacterium violaceum]MBX9267501.1 hypothetical protein [Chromobacterium violaceum]
MNPSNLIGSMAASLHALNTPSTWNATAECCMPTLPEDDAHFSQSCAEITQTDVACGLQCLGQLLTSYPRDIGNEAELLPQIGSLLRVLGGGLELANATAQLTDDQLDRHAQLVRQAS